jgi:uncharacterized membrane protein YjdF
MKPMAPYQKPRPPTAWMMFVEFPAATAIFVIASLNLAYRPIWLITLVSLILLPVAQLYFRQRYDIRIPFPILLLAFAAVEIDTVGNHFRWYQKLPWPIPYDVFAHLLIPALLAPALLWLTRAWFARLGYRLPLGIITFIALQVNFSLAGFYEITELWDDFYFGGARIKDLYDTPRDLQWSFIGALLGSLLTYAAMKIAQRTVTLFPKHQRLHPRRAKIRRAMGENAHAAFQGRR